MFTAAFLQHYPTPWRVGDETSPEVVDCHGDNVIGFEADTPEDREFWENVVAAVNRFEDNTHRSNLIAAGMAIAAGIAIHGVGARKCRDCGITEIPPGTTTIEGEPLCWHDDDLCSRCQDVSQRQLEQDAARYRYLRNRQTRPIDMAAGGLFAGLVPENLILGGGDLDRAIDAQLGADLPELETLEHRLATCLAQAIDGVLITGRDEVVGGSDIPPREIRLGFFLPQVTEQACLLLEEAGL